MKTKANNQNSVYEDADDLSPVPGVEKIARAMTLQGKPYGIALKVRGETLLLKLELTLPAAQHQLHKWLLENGFDQLRKDWAATAIGPRLLARANQRTILVVESPGYHEWHQGKTTYRILVWNGHVHFLGQKFKHAVVPIEAAAAKTAVRGNARLLRKAIEKECKSHPRVLVAACFSLSAAIRRLCQVPAQLLVLSGFSGGGKSSTQRLLMAMAGPANLARADNSTPTSMQEKLAERPDMPVFFDEMTPERGGKALKNFMLIAANSAARGRSKYFRDGGKTDPIEATPIISTNKSVEDLIGEKIPDEIRARVFTVRVTEDQPMFDKKVEPSSVAHGKKLHRIANQNYGAVWDRYVEAIGAQALKIIKSYETRIDKLGLKIAKRAGMEHDVLDETSKRVLDGLAFAAFAGQTATRVGHWEIRTQKILDAFALVFKEYLDSLPRSADETDAEIIEQVRALLLAHLSRFDDFESHVGGMPRPGCVGWIALIDGERCYLWDPGTFDRLVASRKIAGDVYGALKRAGLLKSSDKKNKNTKPFRLQKRIPGHPDKKRGSFVAMLERIRYVQG